MREYSDYNKKELFSRIEKISIERVDNQIITKYDNRVVNVSDVSGRYEVFDIVKYLKEKIELIEQNFTISKYRFQMSRGQQYLKLISDKVVIGGVEFYKSFYILNSSDRSRRLSFNAGLYSYSEDFYMIGANSIGLNKKHLTGVTKAAEDASVGLNGETFNEQIESLDALVGHKVQFSKIRQVILGDKKEIPKINHKKFDAFKNSVRQIKTLTNEQRNMLFTESEKIKEIEHDFYIDAFWAFQIYLRIFNRQDSHIIRNETERIMKITQWAIRNAALESIGI